MPRKKGKGEWGIEGLLLAVEAEHTQEQRSPSRHGHPWLLTCSCMRDREAYVKPGERRKLEQALCLSGKIKITGGTFHSCNSLCVPQQIMGNWGLPADTISLEMGWVGRGMAGGPVLAALRTSDAALQGMEADLGILLLTPQGCTASIELYLGRGAAADCNLPRFSRKGNICKYKMGNYW